MKSSKPRHDAFYWLLTTFLGAAVLLWPAFVSGQPFLFEDTTAYVRGADAAFVKLAVDKTEWSNEIVGPPSKIVPLRPVLAGRSIYYGAFLWLSQAVGSFWWVIFAQALVVVTSITFAMRRVAPLMPYPHLMTVAAVIVLAIATPIAFFSSLVMPDIFAPLGILAGTMLAAGRRPISMAEQIFWFALVAAACLFHSANIIIVGCLALMMLVVRWFRLAPVKVTGVACVAAAVAIGLAGEGAFNFAVQRTLGVPPIRPPFLMARLIDDGPGYRHLREACVGRPLPYEVCRFLPILPQPSDTFLWSPSPTNGAFMVATPNAQRALAQEQFRFAFNVFINYPVEQLTASLHAATRQLRMIGLLEFNYLSRRDAILHKVPYPEAEKHKNTLAFKGEMPTAPTEALTYASLAVALALIFFGWPRLVSRDTGKLSIIGSVMLMIIAGLLINSLICGALSTPHDRYAARVIWLLPLATLLLAVEWLSDKRFEFTR